MELTLTEVIERSKGQLVTLTGLKLARVTRAFKDDLGWHVWAEMLELSRVPPSADVLAEYEVVLGADGSLLNLERKRTRLRADPVQEESA